MFRTEFQLKKWEPDTLGCAWLFVTAWTVARQTPLSMEFSRQEFPPSGDLPNRDRTQVSYTAGRVFTIWTIQKVQ